MNKMISGLAIVLAMTATQAFAADGQVSQNALDAFGLSSLQVVSDADGMNVRGQGSFTYVSGSSESELGTNGDDGGGSGAQNRYKAGSLNKGTSDSAGGTESFSYSIRVTVNTAANGDVSSLTQSVEVGSGGGSWASSR
jgi:hypothetical protein